MGLTLRCGGLATGQWVSHLNVRLPSPAEHSLAQPVAPKLLIWKIWVQA